jgi:hypothetical protein
MLFALLIIMHISASNKMERARETDWSWGTLAWRSFERSTGRLSTPYRYQYQYRYISFHFRIGCNKKEGNGMGGSKLIRLNFVSWVVYLSLDRYL